VRVGSFGARAGQVALGGPGREERGAPRPARPYPGAKGGSTPGYRYVTRCHSGQHGNQCCADAVAHQRQTGCTARSPLGTTLPVRESTLGQIAQCQHGSDQVQQRPGKVMLNDHGDIVIHADVADGDARDRPVRYRDSRGAGGEFLPFPAVACRAMSTMRRCMVPSCSIRVTTTLTLPILSRYAAARACSRLTFKCQDHLSGLAGFWPDKDAQHRSTMRTSEQHPARSEGICPGRQRSRRCLRIRR
jgi:hypothetical protein